MDSSLINLIPNLTARRSTTLLRSEFIDPLPPYTLAPHPIPQQEHNSSGAGIPLRIYFLGTSQPGPGSPHERSLLWSRDDTIAFGPDTTYGEFLALLRRKLDGVDDSRDTGPWQLGVVAEFRGRTVWQFGKQVVDVNAETWGQVVEGLGETRFRGLKVLCWRKG